METSTVEIMNRGMKCLTDHMGIVEAERFISVIIRERFDYTKWQREYFDTKNRKKSAKKLLSLKKYIHIQEKL